MIERPQSPCIKVCVLGPDGRCTGCLRTVGEIAAWSTMSARQQWAVMDALTRRRAVAEDVIERIKTHIAASPAVLFMKGTPDFPQCGFSAQAVAALRAAGVDSFHAVNIFEDPELREALKKYSNWPTYPQLYVKGELVGGCDIVLDMHRSGELKKLLAEAGAV
jgi:monothiol glutaredoxin